MVTRRMNTVKHYAEAVVAITMQTSSGLGVTYVKGGSMESV